MNMIEIFLLLSFIAPFILALALVSGRLQRLVWMLVPIAALPALLVALLLPINSTIELPWLLFGVYITLDETARIFLLFSSSLWLIAGIYASGYFKNDASKQRFFIAFLIAMAGNFGLILAQDMIAFYTFFTLMSLSSYALVVHTRTVEAVNAGRIYITLVIIGEVILFVAFAMAAVAANSLEFAEVRAVLAHAEFRDLIIGLTIAGFGIKAGLIGLHVWLPLAHPVAPTPASAVLSGAMISTGLLGWLRVLPMGETSLIGWGQFLMVAGLLALFFAVLVGLLQKNAKAVLAYSSISKMGLMTMAVGLGLTEPDHWPLILSAILIFALHHGLAKGALFLGVGMIASPVHSKWQGYLLSAALILPALALAGAPWTSGMVAKQLLKEQITLSMSPWASQLVVILMLGSIAASLLMLRFLYLLWQQYKNASSTKSLPLSMWLSWGALLLIIALNPLFVPLSDSIDHFAAKEIISALWPVVMAGILGLLVTMVIFRKKDSLPLNIPPGDLLIIMERVLQFVLPYLKSFSLNILPKWQSSILLVWDSLKSQVQSWSIMEYSENVLGRWSLASTLALMLGLVFLALAGASN